MVTPPFPFITAANGNPDRYIRDIQKAGYDIMVLWDFRCNSFEFRQTDPAFPEYWMERWELYRFNYIGGRWLAERNITHIELYNEPDKDDDCITPAIWEDDVRIRSMALQDAFADHNAVYGTDMKPRLIAGTLSVYWREAFSEPLFRLMHTPFPGNKQNPNFTLFQDYSFHRYGGFSSRSCTQISPTCRSEMSYGIRGGYDNAKAKLASVGYGDMDVIISEFNCFTAAESDNVTHAYFAGKNVADLPATAACLAGMIGHMIKSPGGPPSINIHRLTQSFSTQFPSQITKNGIMFGSVYESPFFLTGSTKSAEAYRLIRRRAGRGAPIWEFGSGGEDINRSFMSVWAADDRYVSCRKISANAKESQLTLCIPKLGPHFLFPPSLHLQAYYIYVNNEEWETHTVVLNLAELPGVEPSGNVVATAVGNNTAFKSTFHGEVAWTAPLGESLTIVFDAPPSSFYMLTVPKVPIRQVALPAMADATVFADGAAAGLEPTLEVSATDRLSISVMKFKAEGLVGDRGVVSAVLQLHLKEATNKESQVMTVLALPDDWHEEGVRWDNLIFLKTPPAKGVATKTTDGFINWWSAPHPQLVGHMTIPPGDLIPWGGEGLYLRLDVTDAVRKNVTQFMLARVWRFDASKGQGIAKLPADNVQGTYFFTSKDTANVTLHPTLLVDYEIRDY